MKITEEDVKRKTWETLVNWAKEIPFVAEPPTTVELPKGDESPDLAARITLPRGEQGILFECKSIGQPRIARNAVNRILRYLERYPEYYGVFAAPYISPKSAEICTRDGVGYLDFAGNCRLSFGTVYIESFHRPGALSAISEHRGHCRSSGGRLSCAVFRRAVPPPSAV